MYANVNDSLRLMLCRLDYQVVFFSFFLVTDYSIYISLPQSLNNESNLPVSYSIWQSKIRYNKIIQICFNVYKEMCKRIGLRNFILRGVSFVPAVCNLFKLGLDHIWRFVVVTITQKDTFFWIIAYHGISIVVVNLVRIRF